MTNTDAAILQDIRKRLDDPTAIQFLLWCHAVNRSIFRSLISRITPAK